MQRTVVISGPTASGKSALALAVAEAIHGEIVSVDSMQLYRGIPIGTAQPTAEEMQRVPHHLVGIHGFDVKADVYDFIRLAENAISEIRSRGHVPVLAGGTGFYLKALLYGLDDLPGDETLRSELNAQYDRDDAFDLLRDRMQKLDPAAAEKWHDCRRESLFRCDGLGNIRYGDKSTARMQIYVSRYEKSHNRPYREQGDSR